MRHNRERLGSLRGAPQRHNAPPLGGEPVKRACSNARRPLHPATSAPNEYTRLRLKAASYQSGLEIGLEITKHRNTEGNEPYDRPKWLGNHETSAIGASRQAISFIFLKFPQVAYYNETPFSLLAPMFRDFQAI